MVLYTFNRRYLEFAEQRLQRQQIQYVVQPAGRGTVNLFFGSSECMDAIRLMVTRPLNELSPEEDFILGGAPDKPCGVGRADANPKLLLNDT